MQLKNGFHLMTTSTHLLPSIPAHNNNQPFSNVNLAVNEVQVSDEEEDISNGNDRVTLYSLYDDQSVANGVTDGVDAQLPRPSENLKFITNEYGFLELLEEDNDSEDSSCTSSSDTDDDSGDDPSPPEEEPDQETSPTASCVTCGCYALQKEFYDSKHCSHDCSIITKINEFKMRNALEEEEKLKQEQEEIKIGAVKREMHEDVTYESKRMKLDVVEEEETGVINNPFRINDLLEAIDPQHQSLFCPVTVVEVIGFRLLLKFVGYSDKYNFWANADSKYIFPVGWTERYSEKSSSQLHFYSPPNFTWESYINSNDQCRVAPDSNFPHINYILNYQNSKVRVGMKVEAVDRRNKNLICVATISCVMGDRFLIHFDSWDSLYDYWTFIGSGDVFYCGYCKDNGIDITPPHCYETPSEFDWDEYLKKTNSTPMPRDLMTPQAHHPYKVGQQVEVIDKRSQRLLRLATITKIEQKTQTVTVHFPSLKSETYDYELHAHSENLHEQNWGSSTGHPLADDDFTDSEDPNRSPSPDHSNFPVCPNHKLCKSVCNVRGPNFPFHSKVRDCPYSTPNMLEYSESGKFTDRVVVFEDAHYDLGGSEVKVKEPEIPEKLKEKPIKLDVKACAVLHKPQNNFTKNSNPINFNNFNGEVKTSEDTSEIPTRSEILTWSHERISGLVQSLCANLPTAEKVAEQFRSNLIDGESFLMLTQNDITNVLKIKLGPAVKIYNLIRLIDLNK